MKRHLCASEMFPVSSGGFQHNNVLATWFHQRLQLVNIHPHSSGSRDNKQGERGWMPGLGGGGQIPRKAGGKQLISMATSPAFLSAAGCAGGRQESPPPLLLFCRFWLERPESEFIEKDRYPAKAAKVFQGVDERDWCKGIIISKCQQQPWMWGETPR